MSAPLPDLILYTRESCHLCAESKALILDLLREREARGLHVPCLVERDIDTDPDWQRAFSLDKGKLVTSGPKLAKSALTACEG